MEAAEFAASTINILNKVFSIDDALERNSDYEVDERLQVQLVRQVAAPCV